MGSKRALISFSIGAKYNDQVWCDVVIMDTSHLLLRRPWLYDRRVIHDGHANTYSFINFNNTKILLLLSKDIGKSKPSRDSTNLLSLTTVEKNDDRLDPRLRFDLSDAKNEDEYEQNKNWCVQRDGPLLVAKHVCCDLYLIDEDQPHEELVQLQVLEHGKKTIIHSYHLRLLQLRG